MALADTITVLETKAPEAGFMMATAGGTLSTVTGTAAEAALFSELSQATALRTCAPPVVNAVFQERE